mmetsp:Transcript_14029/g.21122  ORF Transcript_14029/g.21122 Transcript_14029/m.21122 type:complete len:191 (+) Transcript_14029:109-681(+)
MNKFKQFKSSIPSSSTTTNSTPSNPSSNHKTKSMARKTAELRVQKDLTEMDQVEGVGVSFPQTDDLMTFNVEITPQDGLWKDSTYLFTIDVPESYPFNAPKVHCHTPIFHPNIDLEGHVCLNILRSDWSPVLNLKHVIFGLLTLFHEPNPQDPLNKQAAQMMNEDHSQFEKTVAKTLQGGTFFGVTFPTS